MLLTDILKYTNKEHVEYQILEEALNCILESATKVNEGKRQNDNQKVIKDLQIKFKGRYNSLVQPTRQFIKEGIIHL
jgi:hypothetical protein